MAARGYLAHESPEGLDWVDRLGRARVEGFAMAGENVGAHQQAGARTTRSSRAGSTRRVHRENLLAAPFNATGLGIARSADGTLYYTQLYLSFPRDASGQLPQQPHRVAGAATSYSGNCTVMRRSSQ